jgi:N-acetylglucosamine kinase-like BadF-type ATPase
LDRHSRERRYLFETEGYNPCYQASLSFAEILAHHLPEGFDVNAVKSIYFYGAGVYEVTKPLVGTTMRAVFPNAEVYAESDMLGAARSLLKREKGFAAILGTGSNTCLYDGEQITHNVDSLGFILGDEGSGGYIGKKLLTAYLRGETPIDVSTAFHEHYPYSNDELIQQLYSSKHPNRLCAACTRFLTDEKISGNQYLTEHIIKASFRDFFSNIVSRYPDYRKYTFNSVGSVAWYFRESLKDVALEFGMCTGTIVRHPIDGLVSYYG